MVKRWVRQLDGLQKLVLAVIPLGLLHHADHVLRADHSSWPFRPEVGPFTFTLLVYPILLLPFVVRERRRVLRVALGIAALGTLFAHTLIEPPQQIYGTWANNLSTDALLYRVNPEHSTNLLDVESPLLGGLAAALSVLLTALLLLAWSVVLRERGRRAPG